MQSDEMMLDGGHRGLVLRDRHLRVVVLPDKGCDIYAIEDTRSGVDVLFKSPWGLLAAAPGAYVPDSTAHWLRQYPGGWQVIVPNGGTEAAVAGTRWGFHGEASGVPWSCRRVDEGIDAEVDLFTAPLRLRRRLWLEDGRLRLRESVTNLAPDEVAFMWGHHPAFGAPLLAPGCRVSVGARTYVADDEQAGPGIEPGSRHEWPLVTTTDGGSVDLSVVGEEPVARLGYLTDFHDHWFAIANPRVELGVAGRWSAGVLEHAWFWQELNASPGFPWFRRAYVMAIEPNSTFPAQGLVKAQEKGGTPVVLPGGERADFELDLTLFHGGGPVTDVTEDGGVVQG